MGKENNILKYKQKERWKQVNEERAEGKYNRANSWGGKISNKKQRNNEKKTLKDMY